MFSSSKEKAQLFAFQEVSEKMCLSPTRSIHQKHRENIETAIFIYLASLFSSLLSKNAGIPLHFPARTWRRRPSLSNNILSIHSDCQHRRHARWLCSILCTDTCKFSREGTTKFHNLHLLWNICFVRKIKWIQIAESPFVIRNWITVTFWMIIFLKDA